MILNVLTDVLTNHSVDARKFTKKENKIFSFLEIFYLSENFVNEFNLSGEKMGFFLKKIKCT